MDRLNRFRVIFSTIMAIILVSSSYLLEDNIAGNIGMGGRYFPFIIGFLSLILSIISATFIVEQLLKIKAVRRLVYGNKFIEGFWLFESIKNDNDGFNEKNKEANKLYTPGIGEIFYDKEKKSYMVSFYRYHPEYPSKESYTISNAMTFDDINLRYVNQFTFGTIEGSAFGKFFNSPGQRLPDVYDGILVLGDGTPAIRQRGKKLSEDIIKKAQTEHKENWRIRIIETMYK